jgi:hypothetical protein
MLTLAVVSCGKRKIWDINPHAGPTAARDAYQGSPFKVNREYAEICSDRWVVLSAKYGFIDPDFRIPCNYNVTFDDSSSNPISIADLVRQAKDMALNRFDRVVVLGNRQYSDRVEAALSDIHCEIISPRVGLRTGEANAQVKSLTARCRQKGIAP